MGSAYLAEVCASICTRETSKETQVFHSELPFGSMEKTPNNSNVYYFKYQASQDFTPYTTTKAREPG